MAASELPDVILMDVALGEMDGWEATQHIKGNPATGRIPIIALTAHTLESDRERSLEVGCSDFDTKPVDIERLLGKIRASTEVSGPEPEADDRRRAARERILRRELSRLQVEASVARFAISPRREQTSKLRVRTESRGYARS
jgi:CheY-like chemotaxis protein